MAEAAKTPPGPWPSWRALLWAPALPGVPCWLAASVFAVTGLREGMVAGAALIMIPIFVVALGYGVALLCGVLHRPFARAGWSGPWAYGALGLLGAALAAPLVQLEIAAWFAPFSVLTGVNFWWIRSRRMGVAHRIANGLWVVTGLVALAGLGYVLFSHP